MWLPASAGTSTWRGFRLQADGRSVASAFQAERQRNVASAFHAAWIAAALSITLVLPLSASKPPAHTTEPRRRLPAFPPSVQRVVLVERYVRSERRGSHGPE